MQIDFHYYCTAVLARAAGFSSEDSQKIAYSCQYVDNATESELLQINSTCFEPVRTAHQGLLSFDWSIQRNVFIPFHFLPHTLGALVNGEFDTKADSHFAQKILIKAKDDITNRRILKIGIALHTYEDTWSHEPFSGRNNVENDCDKVSIMNKGLLQVVKEIKYNAFDILVNRIKVDVGHLKAGYLPDIPFLNWKCYVGGKVHNFFANRYVIAAKCVYEYLCSALENKPVKSWRELEQSVTRALSYVEWNLDRRCENWRLLYKELFGVELRSYNQLDWRKDALNAKENKLVMWEYSKFDFSKANYKVENNFDRKEWFLFHKAAEEQLRMVMREMRG